MLKGWKTILINSLFAIFGVLESADWINLIGSDKAGYAATTIAIINMILRTRTTTPAFKGNSDGTDYYSNIRN